jgi:hypothetical protein
MSNHSSPHGGKFVPGTVVHGTLLIADLLRAFADEYERLVPFDSRALVGAARAVDPDSDEADEIVIELFDALDGCAQREGNYTFAAHEGDGSDFGFWPVDDE